MSNPVSIKTQYFNRVFDSWKYAIASVNVRFVSVCVDDSWTLFSAQVEFSPFECENEKNHLFRTAQLQVGEIVTPINVSEVTEFMKNIRLGRVEIKGLNLKLPDDDGISSYVPIMQNEPDYFVPELEVRGNSKFALTHQFDYAQSNAELRCGEIPFDGLADLLSFYGLSVQGNCMPTALCITSASCLAALAMYRCSRREIWRRVTRTA